MDIAAFRFDCARPMPGEQTPFSNRRHATAAFVSAHAPPLRYDRPEIASLYSETGKKIPVVEFSRAAARLPLA